MVLFVTCRGNTKIGVRVNECERSNPSTRQESLTGGVTIPISSIFTKVIHLNEYYAEVPFHFSDKRKKKEV